jgi:cyclase
VLEWAKRVEELGAGEIVITSIDKEGTGEGFDLDLIRMVSTSVGIPVIAHGGMGNVQDAVSAVHGAKANALAVSSVLHYGFIEKNRNLDISKEEGNTQFLKSGTRYSKINNLTLSEIKNYLRENNIDCRTI